MMACTLDTVTNSLCADWMTPLRSAKKRPVVRRLSAKVVAAVVPAPLVRILQGTSSGPSEGAAKQLCSDEPSTTAKSSESSNSGKSNSGKSNSGKSRSSAASVHSVAVVPAP